MELACKEARQAYEADEVPVGAVLVSFEGRVLYASGNRVIRDRDPSAHAEMLAIRGACKKTGNYRLLNTTLYATVEPCIMCAGAIVHARIARVCFGAKDPKWGGFGSIVDLSSRPGLNHRVEILPRLMEDSCREMLQRFFAEKRMIKAKS